MQAAELETSRIVWWTNAGKSAKRSEYNVTSYRTIFVISGHEGNKRKMTSYAWTS